MWSIYRTKKKRKQMVRSKHRTCGFCTGIYLNRIVYYINFKYTALPLHKCSEIVCFYLATYIFLQFILVYYFDMPACILSIISLYGLHLSILNFISHLYLYSHKCSLKKYHFNTTTTSHQWRWCNVVIFYLPDMLCWFFFYFHRQFS